MTTTLSSSQITELENVLSKLYNSNVPNDERKKIEQWLNDMYSENSWATGLMLLSQQSQYLSFFGLHLLENNVKRRSVWDSLSVANKTTIKSTLLSLLQNYKSMNNAVWTKVCLLLVTVAKIEWPEKWPDFLQQIVSLTSNQQTIVVGLTLFNMISEEFSSEREDLDSTRRSQLKNHLLSQISNILQFLKQILDSFWGQAISNKSAFQNPAFASIVTLALKCISNFFGWIPLAQYVSIPLLSVVHNYTTSPNITISIAALSCFTEILGKPISIGAEAVLNECYRHTLSILQNFLSQYKSMSEMENVDSDYLEKLSLLQYFFILNHLRSLEKTNFPILQFLSMFYKFTFIQADTERFGFCLDALVILVDSLLNEKDLQDESSYRALLEKYRPAFDAFTIDILKRTQFTQMGEGYLFELEDERVSQQKQTELDQYLEQCIEVLGGIGELFFESVIPKVQSNYLRLMNDFANMNKISLENEFPSMSSEEKGAYAICRDMITCLSVVGRLSEKFCSTFEQTLSSSVQLLGESLRLLQNMLSNRLHANGRIYALLEQEIFNALQMFNSWLKLYGKNKQTLRDFQKLIVMFFECILKALDPNVNSTMEVLDGASGLILSLFYNFSDLPLTELQPYSIIVQNLNPLTQHILGKFSFEQCEPMLKRLYAAISNSILLKQGTDILEWQKESYRQFIHSYIETEYQKVLSLIQQRQFTHSTGKLSHLFAHVFKSLTDSVDTGLPAVLSLSKAIVDSVHDKSKVARSIVHQNLKFLIDSLLDMFRTFIDSPKILHLLLDLILAIFNSLGAQVGMQYIQQTVETFLSLFTRDTMYKLQMDTSGRYVIISFLELLTALMSDGSSRFVSLTGKIVLVCRDIIHQSIMPESMEAYSSARISMDILSKYYTLLYTIIHSNWRYFFTLQQAPTSQETMVQFYFILECFLRTVRLPDVQLLKANLGLLEGLNTTRRLYSREVFTNQIMQPFLTALFDVLVAKSHQLLQDDLIKTVFNMVQGNWSRFKDQFIPQYLSTVHGLTDMEVKSLQHVLFEGDPQNSTVFSQNIGKFLTDLRFCLNMKQANRTISILSH